MDDLRLSGTRSAWQTLAEHVLSAALYEATGRIGLRANPGGFATPAFAGPHGSTWICVVGAELLVTDDDGERRAVISTLAAAGEFVGMRPGAAASVYTPTTPLDLDAPLVVDRGAAGLLATFFTDVDAALEVLRLECAAEEPAPVQLWPEHFDLATTISEVNYGGSPGDAGHPGPYLYVGPFTPRVPDGGFWNEPFGASLDWSAVASPADASTFFRSGRAKAAELDVSS